MLSKVILSAVSNYEAKCSRVVIANLITAFDYKKNVITTNISQRGVQISTIY